MKPLDHAEVQLQHAPLSCRHVLLLRCIDDERLRLCGRSVKIPNLLGGQHPRSKKRNEHSCKHHTKEHHCPPAVSDVPEAIIFLICASTSSLLPSPAVSSTTTPFLST